MRHFISLTTFGLLLQFPFTMNILAAEYPKPEITCMMFHVDKLPLDHDRIRAISEELTILASKNPNGNQQRLTANARLLAVALRLNSKNELAKELNRKYSNNLNVADPSQEIYDRSLLRALILVRALSNRPEKDDAHLLVNYIKDALVSLGINDPILNQHQLNEIRWRYILPKSKVSNDPPRKDDSRNENQTKLDENKDQNQANEQSSPAPKADDNTEIQTDTKWQHLVSEVEEPMLLIKKTLDSDRHYLDQCKFKVKIRPQGEESEIDLTVHYFANDDDEMEMQKKLRKFLLKKRKHFPGAKIKVELSGTYSDRNGDLVMLPVLLQLEASLNGTKIKEGVRVLGRLDHNGNIKRNRQIWRQIAKLREDSSLKHTLICPIDAEMDFRQIVALEEAEFFIRNEVILVKNLDEAVQFSGELKDEKLRIAHEEFVKIRDKVGTKSVGSFSVDKSIRTTLENILELNPNHLSAKMILLRGDTKRSSKLEPYFVAEQFKGIVKSLEYITLKEDEQHLGFRDMDRRATLLENALKPFKRYIDTEDKGFISSLEEMVDELNNLSRALKKDDSDYHKRSARIAHDRFKKHYEEALEYIEKVQKVEDK